MTRDIFLYGTLRDAGQRAAVLGHSGTILGEGALPAHAVRTAPGTGAFPVLLEDADSEAPGLVLSATSGDLRRLDWYEAMHGYERKPVTLASGRPVEAYLGASAEAGSDEWKLETWCADWGPVVEIAAREAMAVFPDTPPGQVGRRYGMLLSQAAALVRARSEVAPGAVRKGAGRKGVEVSRSIPRHRGFFALDEIQLEHRRFDGGRESITREVFVGTDAALVLPYDPEADRVVLIEQFRTGPFRRGDRNPWCLEPVAGLVDPGESPETCARREAMEEAGVELSEIVRVPGGYPSPGVTTEFYHLFIGLADLSAYQPRTAGLAEEGEDILSHPMPLRTALSLLETGEANVLPLAYLLTWTAANRDRLRAVPRH